jgi:hypothetical protein
LVVVVVEIAPAALFEALWLVVAIVLMCIRRVGALQIESVFDVVWIHFCLSIRSTLLPMVQKNPCSRPSEVHRISLSVAVVQMLFGHALAYVIEDLKLK